MSATSSARVPRPSAGGHSWSETAWWCDTDVLLCRWREDRDRDAREELVARFLPLARRLAGHYRGSAEPLEDLVQVASLGLLGAIDRFDPARGIPFPAFAVPSILGALKHYFRDTGWSVHVSPEAQEWALRVDRAAREITAHSGRPVRIAELAEQLEVTTDQVLAGIATATAHYSISLDTPAFAGDSDEPDALIESLGTEDDTYDVVETVLSVTAAVTRLPDLERQALALRLDFAMTQTEIAQRLNCSQMQVSRLLHRAAARLHQLLDPPLNERELSAVGRDQTGTHATLPCGATSATLRRHLAATALPPPVRTHTQAPRTAQPPAPSATARAPVQVATARTERPQLRPVNPRPRRRAVATVRFLGSRGERPRSSEITVVAVEVV